MVIPMGRTRIYTDEQRIERRRKASRKYYDTNKEKWRQRYLANRDNQLEYFRAYHFKNRMRISEERRLKYAEKKISLTNNITNNESKD